MNGKAIKTVPDYVNSVFTIRSAYKRYGIGKPADRIHMRPAALWTGRCDEKQKYVGTKGCS